MIGHIFGAWPIIRVFVQDLSKQIDGFWTDTIEHFLRENKILLLDFGDHFLVVPLKGMAACQ